MGGGGGWSGFNLESVWPVIMSVCGKITDINSICICWIDLKLGTQLTIAKKRIPMVFITISIQLIKYAHTDLIPDFPILAIPEAISWDKADFPILVIPETISWDKA